MAGFLSYDLAQAFALKRNKDINFPFLKENGELLCIARAQGFLMEPRVEELYKPFYSSALQLIELYPQYYRFLLGIVIDLEDLGMDGHVSHEICQFIRQRNLLAFDTSDLRRLEALHLLGRRVVLTETEIEFRYALVERLQKFTMNKANFFKFNRPLFYELTHLVFFLTDYGRHKHIGFANLEDCLLTVGFMSVLDDDIDLLSEIILCLNFIGCDVPDYWKTIVLDKQNDIEISFEQTFTSSLNKSVDDYHVYFVLNWCLSSLGERAFSTRFNSRTPSFKCTQTDNSLLSKISMHTHAKLMNGSYRVHSDDTFMQDLDVKERHKLDCAIKSIHLSVECLKGLSNEVLSFAA